MKKVQDTDLPISRIDLTPAEISATGHLANSGRSADISRADNGRFSLKLRNANEQLTVLTCTMNTSQAKKIRGFSIIYAPNRGERCTLLLRRPTEFRFRPLTETGS